jgi:uroporphyrin-III C-methyltransferase
MSERQSGLAGHVSFVGAGPGAADLITLRGAQRLASADVVLADALADPALRALAPKARWIAVGKRGFRAGATPQAQIDALLVTCARRHRQVVRLKGGDPSVFGRLEEEIEALSAAGIPFDIVPGVTAALAAAATTARPLTRRGRGRSLTLATAMAQEGAIAAERPRADTEVFYMAGRQLPALSRRLRAAGWAADAPCCVVSNAGAADALASQHRLADLAAAAVLHAGRPLVVTLGVGAEAVASLAPAASGSIQAKARPEAAPKIAGSEHHPPTGPT